MIQARQPESSFDGPEQRKMSVKLAAPQFVEAIVGVYDGCNLVDGWRDAVVIFVPDGNNDIAAHAPCRRSMDRGYYPLECLIAKRHQCGIQANLGAVVVGILVAELRAVIAAVLVIALVGDDEGVVWHSAATQITVETTRSVKRSHIGQAVSSSSTLFGRQEISERIVLYGVKLHDLARAEGGRLCRPQRVEQGKVSEVGKVTVAVVNVVGTSDRKAFLISLPAFPGRDQLVCDAHTQNIGIGCIRFDAINVVHTRGSGSLIAVVNSGRGRVGSGARDWANGIRIRFEIRHHGSDVRRARQVVPV